MGSKPCEGQSQPEESQPAVERPSKTNEYQAVLSFMRAISCDVDLDTSFRLIMQMYKDLFHSAHAGALFFYHPGPDRLAAASAFGYDTEALGGVSLRSGESIAGQAFQTGQAALYPTPQLVAAAMADMTPENRALFERAMDDAKQPNSVICVPLVCTDAKFGAVVLENWGTDEQFSEHDLDSAQALARLAALVVDRRVLAERLRQNGELLMDAGSLQETIMTALSHDMRTPLASIKGYASALLLDDLHWDEQTKRDYLAIIGEQADRLTEIVGDLLEVSVIDAGKLHLEKEPMLLPRLAQQVVDEAALRTDQHRFLLSFPPGFPVVDADTGRIRRVLFNLVDNAVKYSPDGGLVVVRGEVRENEVVVSVADQGAGIAPEHLNRLFERFFRVKFVGGQHVAGSGLGLPIARTIVELHGGRIWAESRPGEGTTLHFTLPRAGPSSEMENLEE